MTHTYMTHTHSNCFKVFKKKETKISVKGTEGLSHSSSNNTKAVTARVNPAVLAGARNQVFTAESGLKAQ